MPKCDFNKVASNFIEITLRYGCSPVNLLHIFITPFPKNTSRRLLLNVNDGTMIMIVIMVRYRHVTYSEADLGLLQHPRWSTL